MRPENSSSGIEGVQRRGRGMEGMRLLAEGVNAEWEIFIRISLGDGVGVGMFVSVRVFVMGGFV